MKIGFLKEDSHVAQLSRHAHDLSQSFCFTSSTGMILPVYQDFLNAGDADYFSGSLLARAQPFVTQAMVDVEFYVDWFFVPMTMILNAWQNVRWQTRDFISGAFGQTNRSFYKGQLPVYNIGDFNNCKDSQGNYSPSASLIYEAFSFDCCGKAKFRLLNHLGFNPFGVFADATLNPNYDAQNLPSRVNPNVFPQFALAYQAIFYDYFRVDDRTDRNILAFNADGYYAFSQAAPLTRSSAYVADPFVLHYRPYHDDYFTGVQTSPITSSVNLIGGFTSSGGVGTPAEVLSQLDNYLGIDVGYLDFPGTSDATDSTYKEGVGDLGSTLTNIKASRNATAGVMSTANIRQMFAVEKLMRITGKAAKNYDAQMLAHFGVKIPHDVKHDLTHLGCDKALMHIGQVVSTSDTFDGTSGSALGSLSGQGYVVLKGRKRKFTAPVDGIIMAVASCVPSKYYYGAFDKLNSVATRLDYFIPEYDRLGKQPLYAYEADFDLIGTANRVGWQWRYNQYKRKYNRVTEAFRQPRNNTSVNQYMPWINASLPLNGLKPLSGGTYEDVRNRSIYCTPHELDNCMVVPYVSGWSTSYNTTPWLMFASDPFINSFRADVKKVSVMSPTGEPQL